jgi:hypothetical protein
VSHSPVRHAVRAFVPRSDRTVGNPFEKRQGILVLVRLAFALEEVVLVIL